jgi:hypothetical protein
MAEVVSGRNLTTIVLNETEIQYLRDVLSDVEIRSRQEDSFAATQIAVLYDLWTAVSDAEQFEPEEDLLTIAGEAYHFREPDLAEPDGK